MKLRVYDSVVAKLWKHPKPVIGVVGGIGAGKSLVARLLAAEGCGVIDSDAIAKRALLDPEIRDQLVQWWGDRILGHDGHVERRAVAAEVFENPQELERLESIVHPRVHAERKRLRKRYFEDSKVRAVVEDTPLLFEAGLDEDCDVVIFVDADRETRLQRLGQERGWSAKNLDQREKNQLPLDIKRQRADYVITNNAGEQEAISHVRHVLSEIFQEIDEL